MRRQIVTINADSPAGLASSVRRIIMSVAAGEFERPADPAFGEWRRINSGAAFLAAQLGLASGPTAAHSAVSFRSLGDPLADQDLEAVAGVCWTTVARHG